jgi:hypothetical protein
MELCPKTKNWIKRHIFLVNVNPQIVFANI